MLLSQSEIVRLIHEQDPPLVEGVDAYQLMPPSAGGVAEGPCVEMRIGRVFTHDAERVPVLGYDVVESGSPRKIVRYVPEADLVENPAGLMDRGTPLDLKKGKAITVESIERLNLPNSSEMALVGLVEPRFSLARMGVQMLKSDADPGYSGPIVVRLVNLGPFDVVRFEIGARIAKIRFIPVSGSSPSYVGRYGGKPGGVLEVT